MNLLPAENREHRLLILAPVGKDATLLRSMLAAESIPSAICPDLEDLVVEMGRGLAAVLIAEEALTPGDGRLVEWFEDQPPWSDLPVLLLTRRGADSSAAVRAVGTLGNVTLLERPVRVAALASAVRSALRARQRQYQTRAHLIEREQADRRKDEFLATLAHELRNPLAPLRNSVQVMRLSSIGESDGRLLQMMDRQVDHMVRLVDDLMEVSRITRGKIELRRERVDLADVIAAVLETSASQVEAAGHTLNLDGPSEPLVVEADATRLGQVFSNLINNAIKYTDSGGRIGVTVRREENEVVVGVSDTGIGISAEALPRVFEMFVQADARDMRAQTGLGIGLTLVRSLVEMHGGRVEARSAGRGCGSQFIVRIPLVGGQPARTEAGRAVADFAGGGPRVLVVDDNRDAADSLGAVLKLLGAAVRVEYDGESALVVLDDFRPAVVFLDLGMPGMDGYEAASRIRERPVGREAVLVALTGWGQDRDRKRTDHAGFDRHLVKPAKMDVLRSVLASVAS